MSSTTPIIHCPLAPEQVNPEERLELGWGAQLFDRPIVIAPWRSLMAAGKLDTLDSIPKEKCYATILKFEWESREITSRILDMGFKVLFCTSTSKGWPIQNFAYPDYVAPEFAPNPVKDIPFSFVGWDNNHVRRRIFELYKGNPSVISRDWYHFDFRQRQKEYETQFTDILSRSRFGLCPRGVGSGTRRIWECLRCGAIPIIMSDNWFPPSCWNWADTCIFLKEHEMLRSPHKINNAIILPQGREETLRKNCFLASAEFDNTIFLTNYINSILNAQPVSI